MSGKRNKWVVVIFAILTLAICSYSLLCNKKSNNETSAVSSNDYVGEQTCKSCHTQEYDHWLKSDHFKAMQVANDSTVLGNFNNTSYTADGVTTHFFKKDGKYFINTESEDGSYKDYEVKYTFGHYPLQQYLIDFPKGKKQVSRASWDSRKNKWFYQYAGQKIPAGDWLHWTGNAQNWNSTCADCHSTNLQKSYKEEDDSYHTTYNAINVSCESCHGPGKKHVDYIKIDYKEGKKVKDSYLMLTQNSSQTAIINTCSPCHSRRSPVGSNLLLSDEFMDNYIPELPTTENFYADGQMKGEVFIYTSFMQSKMAQVGVQCNNCHQPHTGKTKLIGNSLCLSCHQPKYNDISHTLHAANIAGAKCVSCHMPGETYMGNDFRHDHSFRVPRPDLSAKFATPNACNNCHKDKSSQWAADIIVKKYGKNRVYHFSEDLILGSKAEPNAEPHLYKLLENKAVPSIIKSTAAFYLSNHQTQQSLEALLKCLKSKEADIRYTALRSLLNFPQQTWQASAMSLLKDKVRAVRVAAGDLFLLTPEDQLPDEYQSALRNAKNELSDFLKNQTDFPSGNIQMGDYYSRLKDYANAEKYYLRGLKKDNLMNLARLNLSVVYNLQGKNEQALKTLQEAVKIDSKNSQIFYNMALLYNEMGKSKEAIVSFDQCLKLKPNNPRIYYNYGLLLAKDNPSKAEQVLLSGLKQWQNENSLHYALAYLYLNQGKKNEAIKYARFLKQNDPNNPDYQAVFNNLGL